MIKMGQWVYGYSDGVFHVDRVVERFIDESVDPVARQGRELGEPFPSPLVVLKKCVDGSFLPSIGYEVCDATLCRPLGPLGRWRLKRAFIKNPDLYAKFNAYEIPTIQSRYGLWLCAPDGYEKDFFALIDFVKGGVTFLQIKNFMLESDLWQYHRLPINRTLYFVNIDFELDESKRQIFRYAEFAAG